MTRSLANRTAMPIRSSPVPWLEGTDSTPRSIYPPIAIHTLIRACTMTTQRVWRSHEATWLTTDLYSNMVFAHERRSQYCASQRNQRRRIRRQPCIRLRSVGRNLVWFLPLTTPSCWCLRGSWNVQGKWRLFPHRFWQDRLESQSQQSFYIQLYQRTMVRRQRHRAGGREHVRFSKYV